MTDYKGPSALRTTPPVSAPKIVPPYQRSPGGVVRNADGPAFNNRFPKSRYRGGGQGGPQIVESGGGGDGDNVLQLGGLNLQLDSQNLTLGA